VLVVRLSSLGDIVLTEPVLAALARELPGCEVGFAVKSAYSDLVSAHPGVARVHTLDPGRRGALSALCRDVRSRAYGAVVDLHRSARSAAIVRAARAPISTSVRKRERGDWLSVRVLGRPFRARKKLVERYLEALAPLGISAPYAAPRLHVPEADRRRAGAYLASRGLDRGFAVIAPGAVWATKRWLAEGFARVAGALSKDGIPVVLAGSVAERGLCLRVASEAGAPVLVTAGETGLGETAAIIERAALFVGNDSGLMHVAMALDTPTVAVFGPTDPGQFDFTGHALVFADVPCSACSFYGGRRCRLGHWDCMRLVESSDVVRAARALLAARGGTA
jgi:heptosyltransferase-2